MSESMTGGLVEELRALLAEGEHADTCGSVLSPEAGYPCSCWKADLTVLLDVHASRTANDPRPCKGSNVNICVAEGCYDKACTRAMGDNVAVSSSPEPGAVEALARLLFASMPKNADEPDDSWASAQPWDQDAWRDGARGVLAAGYLSPADVKAATGAYAKGWNAHLRGTLGAVAAAKAEALREAAVKWRAFVADGRCPTCQMASRETVGMVCQTCGTDYGSAAGPERRTEPADPHRVTQTIVASPEMNKQGVYGNCMQAAFASLLGKPLDAVPHFGAFSTWPDALRLWLAGDDLEYVSVPPEDLTAEPCVLVGPSLRGFSHAVVGNGNEVIWDPHPSRAGLTKVTGGLVVRPRQFDDGGSTEPDEAERTPEELLDSPGATTGGDE